MTTRLWRPRFSLLTGMVAAWGLVDCSAYRAPPFALGPASSGSDQHFTVIGDLQSTLAVEAWRENNDAERRRLLPEVARRKPAFVIMVGDLVSWGSSRERWQEFDQRSADLRRHGIPVLPVPGNHDYWGDADLGLYFAHFPEIRGQRWYERRYGSVAMVFLDSNLDVLRREQRDEQRRFYETTLLRLDADDRVRGVLVFLHHAPVTNSSVVRDDADVLRDFVPAFASSTKTLALVTGHAHGYERFERNGKAFIVTAGGGGPRGPLLAANERRHHDDLFRGPPVRNFNFVEFRPSERGLHAYVVGLPKGERRFCRMEEFDLLWPGGESRPTVAPPTGARLPEDLPECYD
jgi:Icc-related predicted phosphoesterase